MWVAFVLLLAALAVPITKPHYQVADKVFLEKQKDILRLFNHVNQPSYYKDFVEIADAFKFEGNWDLWTKPEYAKEFYHYFEHDILPQGEVFSVFYPEHLKQAIALFRTLYHVQDYETFYKIAVWARQHVNEAMFVYALSVATVHGRHTNGVLLPPIYEIYPHYFFSDEVMYKAQQYKQHEDEIKNKSYQGYTIHANYSGRYMNVHPEQSMTYFTEDIGINAYYYYHHIFAPFWMTRKEIFYYTPKRGEFFFWRHQQLLARYYLERLSNGLGEIPHFEYEYPIETGYYPRLTYTNGLHFPTRPNHANLYYAGEQRYPHYGNYSNSYTYVKDYERRLRDALDKGHIYTEDGEVVSLFDRHGFETLGRLVESNADSPNRRYYGDLLLYARHLLGYAYYPLDEYQVVPSALEHFETSLRDPMFYQMYERILTYVYQHQQYKGPYQHEDLNFQGVKIEGMQVDRLITFFDHYYADLTKGLYVDEKEFHEDTFQVRARQYRLNHKAFNYKINVESERATQTLVKVFIGPKYDAYGRVIDIEHNRRNFYEIDRFHHNLRSGKNVIERNSRESVYFSRDRSYKQLYEEVATAINGGGKFKVYDPLEYYGFPQRYMLPKGDFGGKTYQFYAIVAPYHAQTKDNMATRYEVCTEYSMGYPFDKPIVHKHDFYVQNSFFKDVVVYHKNVEEDINTT